MHSHERPTVHIVPTNDLKPHVETGTYCHCKPRVEYDEGQNIVIHWAYDGREFDEDKPGH